MECRPQGAGFYQLLLAEKINMRPQQSFIRLKHMAIFTAKNRLIWHYLVENMQKHLPFIWHTVVLNFLHETLKSL